MDKKRKNKIIRILIIISSMIIAYRIYESEYFIKANKVSIERGIEDFIKKDITVMHYKKFKNVLIVYYTSPSGRSYGATVLYRGFNNRYQIRTAGYGMKLKFFISKTFQSNGENYLAVVGENYNGIVDKVIVENDHMVKEFSTNGETYIIKLFKSKFESNYIFNNYILFDNRGKDITEQMEESYCTIGDYGISTGADVFTLNLTCIIVLLSGILASRFFKDSLSLDRVDGGGF